VLEVNDTGAGMENKRVPRPLENVFKSGWDLQLFAEGQDEGDKTEEPTPHRLKEARRKGQVFKSMELNSALNILGVMFLFLLLSNMVYPALENMVSHYLAGAAHAEYSQANAGAMLSEAIGLYFSIIFPVFVVAVLIAVVANMVQVGFLFAGEHIKPKFNKINPVEGAKKIISRKALFEFFKAIAKIAIIGSVTFLFLRGYLEEMLLLVGQEVAIAANLFWHVMVRIGLAVGLVFLGLAFLDWIYQRYEFQQQLRMSKREVKEEHKQLEGDPQIQSKIKEKQRHIARQRMLQEVPSADVVITNPTEVAVALRYKEGEDEAPVLVASGVEVIARKIREIAEENEVPVVQNPPVARAIWENTELGEEIPVEMYQAVAEILAMVYRMKEKE